MDGLGDGAARAAVPDARDPAVRRILERFAAEEIGWRAATAELGMAPDFYALRDLMAEAELAIPLPSRIERR
jgi:hypothetical protein